jgi:anti-sigma regulatory factor (Ser/Thr protein kinase)
VTAAPRGGDGTEGRQVGGAPASLRLRAVPASASEARRAVRDWCTSFGARASAEDVALAVTEVVANAVLYAYEGRPTGDIVVRGSRTDAGFEISVRDFGVGVNARSGRSGGLGFGLRLVGQLTESVQVTDVGPGTLVTMRFPV